MWVLVRDTGGVGTYTVNISQTTSLVAPFDRIVAGSPLNGLIPINTPYSDGFGDNRGVSADIFGNIWYLSTNLSEILPTYPILTNQPIFAVSIDKGITFNTVFELPTDLPRPPEGLVLMIIRNIVLAEILKKELMGYIS